MKDNRILRWCAVGLGLIAVIWVSVLLAPTLGGGLPSMLPKLGGSLFPSSAAVVV